jgi:serine/threonine-protein kinase
MSDLRGEELTAQEIADRAFNLGLLDERQLQQVWGELGSQVAPADDFLRACVRRELLTNYQVEKLVRGDSAGFFFGDYRALYFMGAGSFARVFRAVHRDTGQVVAIKVLRRRFSDSPSQYGQFVREGELGRSLRHPNIVPIYEVYSRGSTHFLVMEFVEGQNLRDFVKTRGKLTADEATRLVTDIANGLQHAFEKNTTHRDLKMTNVLVSSLGNAKIVDFGLAAMEEVSSRDAWVEMPGTRTIDYAALERITGVRKDDTRSDIYFMGCIYYHMLAGKAPLAETKDRSKRLSRQRFEEVVPIQQADSSVPASVAIVVNKAMALDPDRRYQTPDEMVRDLELATRKLQDGTADEEILEDEEVSAARTTPALGHSVMIVESNARLQEVFRENLRGAGFRVLMTSDPKRAQELFYTNTRTAECVLFNAQAMGEAALRAFNRLGENKRTEKVPAMLLLDEPQHAWRKHAKTAEHRVVVLMPIHMKKLQEELLKLVPSKAGS